MANPCEKCPITKKIAYCCRSNPDTGGTKILRFGKSGLRVTACDNLATDGSCESPDGRPEDCKGYVCEEVYSKGLNSQS